MNHVIMVVSFGLMLGPLAGGFITDNFSWHWIFWVNIPVGILAMSVAYIFIKDTHPKKHRPFDVLGIFTFMTAIIFLRLKPNDGYQMLKAPALEKIAVK